MESYAIQDLTFSYADQASVVLDQVTLTIGQGEFVVVCGASGCGKTTLLRQLKTVLAPYGVKTGLITFEGVPLEQLDQRFQSSHIGFVLQNPDNQIVTDKVWHELAFGLESLGYDTATIRLRVAEMASFFGIQSWFYQSVDQLSGGQKQLLNLASIMVMQPKVLILDEPTSQLDPIAAADFLATLGKINRELGTTIILTEHRLEEALPLADRMIVMAQGRVIADGTPTLVGQQLGRINHGMFLAMPVPMQIYAGVPNELACPITVRQGRQWLFDYSQEKPLQRCWEEENVPTQGARAVELAELWFKYEEKSADVIKGLSLNLHYGEILTLLGGNGTGKSTLLSLIAGIYHPYRGQVKINGQLAKDISDQDKFQGMLGVLPQNPQTIFVKKTVALDLLDMLKGQGMSKDQQKQQVASMAQLCQLDQLLGRHPYDLSGGEQQRAALAKVLLLQPKILLLDEPTKGIDAEFKEILADILRKLAMQQTAIMIVSHDVEFCAKLADRCALFFDGGIVTENTPRRFFSGNSFYTTAANRMARHQLPDAITAEDVIKACGAEVPPKHYSKPSKAATQYREMPLSNAQQVIVEKRKLTKRTLLAMLMILVMIPLTIGIGMYYLDDRKYYFISILIILETMLPFVLIFEQRKPQARELIIVAVLCAIGVAGRAAFFMVPQFKPVVAIVIIAGVAFGGEVGFLVGAMTAFVSNMFFGQGPWTPWQMFAFGIIGFLAGVLFRKGILQRGKLSLAVFGGITTFFIYGGIMNPAAVLMFQPRPTIEMFILYYLQGIPFDLIHASASVFFLWIISQPMLEKLDRVKVKYGLIQQ